MWSEFLLVGGLLHVFQASKPNIVLIVVDDLRPALGCYGDAAAFTPHIDKLAGNGVLFTRAYAQQALCAPSRNSFLTSRRPDSLRLYDFYSYWRHDVGNFTTLPQHLRNNGYITKSIGKVFHPGISSNHSDDSPYSWTDVPFHPRTNRYKNDPVCFRTHDSPPKHDLVCPVNVSSTPEGILPDMESLNAAKSFLISQEHSKTPFFLAVGFEKPHIPLKYPLEYTKYHPLDKFKIKNYAWSKNVSSVAYNPWTDIRKRQDVEELSLKFPWDKIPLDFAKKIVQSYYASVSYIDHLIGTLINQLQLLKLANNTIIVLTGDHGWSLGEHGTWAKYSNFDVAVRVPLIVSGQSIDTRGIKMKNNIIHSIVELVDLFPSIADFAQLPTVPLCLNNCTEVCSEGISFLPAIRAALNNQSVVWKKAAFSQYPRPSVEPTWNSDEPRLNNIKIMGYTIRTNRFRYTAWFNFNQIEIKADWANTIAEELYDHKFDSDELINHENNFIYKNRKKKLRKLLKKGWRHALPKEKEKKQ